MLLAGRVRGAHPEAPTRGRELIDRLGLRPVAGSLPAQLSGGEQQRFAIARALVNDPALVLADEPTGNLDVEAGAEVLRLLRAGAAEGRAVVMVTHEAGGGRDRRPRAAPARREARSRDRARARRPARAPRAATLLAAAGVLAASLVVGTGATVGYGLATGFERAADQADLPDVIARFDAEPRDDARRARARAAEPRGALVPLRAHERRRCRPTATTSDRGAMHVVLGRPPRLRDRRRAATCPAAAGEVVIEQGLAREWDLAVGDPLAVGGRGPRACVVGIAVLARQRRLPARARGARLRARARPRGSPRAGQPRAAVAQRPARRPTSRSRRRASVSFGLGQLEFVTREGVRVLLVQAAGIVISLLVAFSLVALVAAGTMLAAGAHADVQRRLGAFGVQRALGFSPGADRRAAGGRGGARRRCPAAALGIAVGALAVAGPAAGAARRAQRAAAGRRAAAAACAALAAVVAIVVAAATWPAWRAARRPPAEILRGGATAPRRHGSARRRPRSRSARASPPPPARAGSPPSPRSASARASSR